jgi:elongation factor G
VKEYGPQAIRNCVLVGHGSSGKTSLAEALLFATKATSRLGSVDDGTSHLDYDEDEKKRRISIRAALASFDWREIHVNLIDTPGYDDFVGEVASAMRVAGNAIITVDATGPLPVGAERAFHMAVEDGHSVLFVATKMDKPHADYAKLAAAIKDTLSKVAIPVQIPIGAGETLEGLIDLVQMRAHTFAKDGSGGSKVGEIPAALAPAAKAAREALIEAVAEVDDELTEKFFEEGGNLTEEEFTSGLRKGVNQGKLYPILIACGKPLYGVTNLLEFIASEGSSPMDRAPIRAADGATTRPRTPDAPMSALVWKTLSEPHVGELSFVRVYSGVLEAGHEAFNSTKGRTEKIGQLFKMIGRERKEVPRAIAGDFACAVKLRESLTGHTLCAKSDAIVLAGITFPNPTHSVAAHALEKSDEEKMGAGLHRLVEEDPTFHHVVDPETKETILSGMGEIHIDVVAGRLKERYGVAIEVAAPRIPYRETIRGKADVQGRHKKQTGGRGQFGDVWLKVEPRSRGAGFEFVDDVVGGVVPGKFIPAVEKGVVETLGMGVLAGYPVVDVRVTIHDGSYHAVDSSDMAFKIAGSMAVKKAILEAKPVLLEPIMEIAVTTPEDYMGDIMGDLSSRRGKILGMESNGSHQVVRAHVPLGELYRYATQLRSLTQGRGSYARAFSHYEEMPKENAEKVIAASATAKTEEE